MRFVWFKKLIKLINFLKTEKILFWSINIFLFILPFFWAGQNVYKIGGDDTRLYLFAPWQWLGNVAQYTWFTEMYNFGNYYPHFYNIPFNIVVGVIKNIFFFLNHERIIYGIVSVIAFSGMYLLITELIEDRKNKNYFYAGIIGGLLYVFLPALYTNFWPNPVSYFYDIAAFPLILYFFFKALHAKKIYPLILGAFVAVVFSISIFHPPLIFSFVICSGIFLGLYFLVIEEDKWRFIKYLLFYLFLILVLSAFYLIPYIHSMFFGNVMSELASNLSSSSGLKITISILAGQESLLTNMSLISHDIFINLGNGQTAGWYDFIFYKSHFTLFLFVFIASVLFFTKKTLTKEYRALVVIAPAILFALFLLTVNIDDWGTRLMIWLMTNVPGFTLIRNFYYKSILVYAIYFSLGFGLAFYLFLNNFKNRFLKIIVILSIIFIIGGFAAPFILGRHYNLPINSSSGSVAYNVQLPSAYLEMLDYLKNLNQDNKVLSFPLIFGSWSMVPSADEKGVYIGGPIMPALAGKTEFSSFMGLLQPYFTPFPNILMDAIKNNDTDFLEKMLGLLNIRYIHYNDGLIKANYEDMDQIKKSFIWFGSTPEDQAKFKTILDSLAVKDKSFGDFQLYKIKDKNYLPHIYPSNNIVYFAGDLDLIGRIMGFKNYKKSDVLFYDRQIGSEDQRKIISSLADKIYIIPSNSSKEIDEIYRQLYFFNDPVNHGLLLDEARKLKKQLSLPDFELNIPQKGSYKILIKKDSSLADYYSKNLKLCFNAICMEKERSEAGNNYFYAGSLSLEEQVYKIKITSDKKEINILEDGDIILEMAKKEKVENIPQIEFKKISPIKYRIKAKNVEKPFLLVFNELFNKQWMLYRNSEQWVDEPNKDYQDVEIQNSVQNQGLASGKFYETYLKNSAAEKEHYLVNTFSNAWRIDPSKLGNKNSDSGYNLDLIIEFYPQRIAIPAFAISIFGLFGCVIYLIYYVIRKHKSS
jgi:hypothetical protein